MNEDGFRRAIRQLENILWEFGSGLRVGLVNS